MLTCSCGLYYDFFFSKWSFWSSFSYLWSVFGNFSLIFGWWKTFFLWYKQHNHQNGLFRMLEYLGFERPIWLFSDRQVVFLLFFTMFFFFFLILVSLTVFSDQQNSADFLFILFFFIFMWYFVFQPFSSNICFYFWPFWKWFVTKQIRDKKDVKSLSVKFCQRTGFFFFSSVLWQKKR